MKLRYHRDSCDLCSYFFVGTDLQVISNAPFLMLHVDALDALLKPQSASSAVARGRFPFGVFYPETCSVLTGNPLPLALKR